MTWIDIILYAVLLAILYKAYNRWGGPKEVRQTGNDAHDGHAQNAHDSGT